MLAFLHLLALSVISQLASAVTIPSLLRTRQAPKVTDALQLKGVDWLRATAECHPVQLADLQRAMMDVSDLAFASLPIPEGSDQSFMDFFGVGYSGNNGRRFWTIFENLAKAGNFPAYGNGRSGEANRIAVRCQDIKSHCRRNMMAYASGYPNPSIVICPDFWAPPARGGTPFPHLHDLVKGPKTSALANLLTMEHIILHELMHMDVCGYQQEIIDIQTTLPGQSDDPNIPGGISNVFAYGVYRCKLLAQKKSPNLSTLRNADSYAWFSSSIFFSRAWGITVDMIEGYVPNSLHPIANAPPNGGVTYGDEVYGDLEWTA